MDGSQIYQERALAYAHAIKKGGGGQETAFFLVYIK